MVNLPQINLPENMIHLGLGQPGTDLLPLAGLRQASARALARTGPEILAYGATRGNPGFREALADFLREHTGTEAAPNQLFITNGNSQALDLICTLFARPGQTVLVESPSYFLALRIFADHGLNLVPVPMDNQGLMPDRLEEILDNCRPAFLYTIPFFHNPMGTTLSLSRQEALVDIARRRNLKIVSDEVYWLLHFNQPPPPSLGRMHPDIPVFSLGSFSKILAPGLRLGWIHTSPETIKTFTRCGVVQSGGGLNPLTSATVEEMIRSGELMAQIRSYRNRYEKRARAFCHMLRQELPDCVAVIQPRGGYFVWLKFPKGVDFLSLRKKIQAHDVDVHPGPYFDPENISPSHNDQPNNSQHGNSRFASCIRLSFALYDRDTLKEGTARLGRALRSLLPELYP